MDDARLMAFGPGPSPGYDPDAAVPRTAARVERGEVRHLEAHLERLMASAAAQGASVPWLPEQARPLRGWVRDASRGSSEALRLRVHGHQMWALLEPLPETPKPYRLVALPHPHGSPHPLAPHKGLLGVWNLAMLRQAQAAGMDDALLQWPDGTFAETAIASIALERDGELWLPPAEGRVASLGERLEFAPWAGARPVRRRAFGAGDAAGGQLWCFNAVRGVWPGTLA